jgi:hypothetical protein
MRFIRIAPLILLSFHAFAADYHVGEGQPFTSIGAVPWAALMPGDNVYIHWRAAPYKEKWVICRQGTAAAPISVIGVPDASGQLPVIEGIGAVTAPGLNYWNEERSIIKIGGANTPPDTMPRYIVIDSLEIRGAQPAYTFTGDDGTTRSYSANASTIYVEKGENITVRNSILHDAGNGLFVASTDAAVSRNILIEGNYIYGNGNSGSIYEHNSYTAAIGITFQYNRYGPLRSGAGGNALKDRSAGLVVRYNWIEGGNRQLDLVDGEDAAAIRNDPAYRTTHVFGNILIENPGDGNRQMVHYGGDSGSSRNYRKGVMYFYNNTLVSYRTDRTTIFRLSTNNERCDARNNILYAAAAGNTVSLLDTNGVLDFLYNWIKPGWVVSFGKFRGTFNNLGGNVQTASPGFVSEATQDFHLASGSAAVNAGTALHPSALPLLRQYVKHQSSEPRPSDMVLDIGAFEK